MICTVLSVGASGNWQPHKTPPAEFPQGAFTVIIKFCGSAEDHLLSATVIVFHLLPRYAQCVENPACRGQHRGKVILVDGRREITAVAGVFHYADTAQIPQYRTDGLCRAVFVYVGCFLGIEAKGIGLPYLPVVVQVVSMGFGVRMST